MKRVIKLTKDEHAAMSHLEGEIDKAYKRWNALQKQRDKSFVTIIKRRDPSFQEPVNLFQRSIFMIDGHLVVTRSGI